jgi:hypothetical protein
MSSVKVAGVNELLFKMRRIEQQAPVAFAFGAYEGLQEIMVEAKALAPEESGDMKKSGYVTPPEVRNGADVTLESGFGGESSEYVVRQEMDTTLNHPKGGQALFFTTALDRGRGRMLETIKRHVAAFLKTGRTTPVPKVVPASPTEGGG